MLPAIDFNDQLLSRGTEVNDIMANRMLASEMNDVELMHS
jgi:hypothetical protein